MDWHGRWRERILGSGLWTIFHDKCWLPGARTCVLCFVNEKHKQTFADDIFLFIIENPEMISHYNLSHEQDVCPVPRMVGGNWGDVSENFVEGVDSRWCYQCWRWCCWCWCWSVGCVGAEIALCWCWSPGLEPLPGRLRSLLSGLTQSPPDPWGTHTHTHTRTHTDWHSLTQTLNFHVEHLPARPPAASLEPTAISCYTIGRHSSDNVQSLRCSASEANNRMPEKFPFIIVRAVLTSSTAWELQTWTPSVSLVLQY